MGLPLERVEEVQELPFPFSDDHVIDKGESLLDVGARDADGVSAEDHLQGRCELLQPPGEDGAGGAACQPQLLQRREPKGLESLMKTQESGPASTR